MAIKWLKRVMLFELETRVHIKIFVMSLICAVGFCRAGSAPIEGLKKAKPKGATEIKKSTAKFAKPADRSISEEYIQSVENALAEKERKAKEFNYNKED